MCGTRWAACPGRRDVEHDVGVKPVSAADPNDVLHAGLNVVRLRKNRESESERTTACWATTCWTTGRVGPTTKAGVGCTSRSTALLPKALVRRHRATLGSVCMSWLTLCSAVSRAWA